MLDPRIIAFEKQQRRDPVGHGCHVIPMNDGTFNVVGLSYQEKVEHVDGEYQGNVKFLVDRSAKRHVVRTDRLEEPSRDSETIAALPDWTPEIEGFLGPDFGTFAQISWNIPSEPDPAFFNIVYGVGHSYWVVLAVNGTTVSDFSQLADGTSGTFTFTYASWPSITAPYTATISLYVDNTLAILINQVTDP